MLVARMEKLKPKFSVGERVLCFEPDQSKARVLYDAKILDADFVKDGKSKKETEYKIHFQGWNSAWDRWANESFVLKNTEENKKLQRKLARRAIKKLKHHGRKKVHLPGVVSIGLACVSSSDSDVSSDSDHPIADLPLEETNDSDESSQSPVNKRRRKKSTASISRQSDDTPSCSTDPTPEVMSMLSHPSSSGLQRKVNQLDIPQVLKRRLDEDNIMITKRNMLVDLPAKLSIVQILENYARHFALNIARLPSSEKNLKSGSQSTDVTPPDKNLNLCKETCHDLRILFDFTLPIVLLYYTEKEQYKNLSCNSRIQNGLTSKQYTRKDNQSSNFDTSSSNEHTEMEDLGSQNEDVKTEQTLMQDATKALLKESATITGSGQSGAHKRRQTNIKQTKIQPHHRKTAEEQIIEETHTYLIPHQPNLDRTGLSNDSQGRRRSSRLSHHLHSPGKSSEEMVISPPLSPETDETSHKTDDLNSSSETTHFIPISMETEIFLRAPSNHHHGIKNDKAVNSPLPLLCREGDRHSCVSSSISLNQMCQEVYVGSAGDDVKRAVHLSQTWKFRLFPPDFKPADGANVPCSLIYGIHHLLRLFIKLPQIFSSMDFPDYKLKIVYKHLHNLLKFLADYDREIFAISDAYVNAT